jgi:hypothetical protein
LFVFVFTNSTFSFSFQSLKKNDFCVVRYICFKTWTELCAQFGVAPAQGARGHRIEIELAPLFLRQLCNPLGQARPKVRCQCVGALARVMHWQEARVVDFCSHGLEGGR